MTIGVAIVGAGFMGRTWAEVAAAHVPGARLVGVTGGTRGAALAQDHGCRRYADLRELADDRAVNVVVLATPPAVHREQALLLAGAGKHLLVEKPMAPTVDECRDIVAACARADVRLSVVSQHRFRVVPRAAKDAVDSGRIGTVTMVQARGAQVGFWDTSVTGDAWKLDPLQQTAYASWAAHACDLIRWYVGSEADNVFATSGSYAPQPPPDRSVMASYRFAGGQLAQVWMSYDIPPPGLGHGLDLLLVGTDGMIEFDAYVGARITDGGAWAPLVEQPAFDAADPRDPVRLAAYVGQFQDLLAAVRSGAQPLVDGQEGLRTTVMLEAAETSMRSGRSVRVDVSTATVSEEP
jgi:predicted dehydrogenase